MPDDNLIIAGDLEGSSLTFSTISSKQYEWKPQEDITAYELAQCMPVLLTATSPSWLNWEQLINDLPDSARRHFKEID